MKLVFRGSLCAVFFLSLTIARLSIAEPTTSISGIPTDEETTISIKKGKKDQKEEVKPEFEIVSDKAEISGEPELMTKEARKSWDRACKEWKKELRDNTEAKVIVANCNSPSCVSASGEMICKSSGDYKLKVKKN